MAQDGTNGNIASQPPLPGAKRSTQTMTSRPLGTRQPILLDESGLVPGMLCHPLLQLACHANRTLASWVHTIAGVHFDEALAAEQAPRPVVAICHVELH